MLSVFFIVVSILTFCLKTHPSMRVIPVGGPTRHVTARWAELASMRVPVIHNSTLAASASVTSLPAAGASRLSGSRPVNVTQLGGGRGHQWMLMKHKTTPHEAFFMIESVCNAWFTFELTIRLSTIVDAPSHHLISSHLS